MLSNIVNNEYKARGKGSVSMCHMDSSNSLFLGTKNIHGEYSSSDSQA